LSPLTFVGGPSFAWSFAKPASHGSNGFTRSLAPRIASIVSGPLNGSAVFAASLPLSFLPHPRAATITSHVSFMRRILQAPPRRHERVRDEEARYDSDRDDEHREQRLDAAERVLVEKRRHAAETRATGHEQQHSRDLH